MDLEGLSREELLKLLDASKELKRRKKKARKAYVPNSGQARVHDSTKPIRVVFSGNGCWAPGTKIRMYDGSTKAVEDVQVGDELMGPDSTPRVVQRLYRGREEMFRVTPRHSDSYVVNKSHKLSIWQWKTKEVVHAERLYKEITVDEFLKLGPETRRKSYQWRPTEGIQYPERDLPIDPYFFGLWLGDGHSKTCAITTMDSEVVEEIEKQAVGAEIRTCNRSTGRATTYFIKTPLGQPNPLLIKFQELGVIRNKHIPDIYKHSSREQRLELLAGIIDSDGHLHSSYYEVTQKRQRLSKDIRELAQSLGFRASTRTKMVNGSPYYRVNIFCPSEKINCRLKYKRMAGPRQRSAYHEAFKIESVGDGQFYGFQVDKDNLLLLDDYTVQRNSGKSACAVNEALWRALGWNPVLKKQTPVPAKVIVVLDDPNKVEDQWIPEIKKWFDDEGWHYLKKGKPYISEINLPNGSEIVFMFHLMEPLKFEGIEMDMVIFDEPPPRHAWIGLRRGGRKKGRSASFLFVGTPITGSWMRTDLYEPWANGSRDDIECFKYGTRVNEQNLEDGYIDKYGRDLTEKEKKIRFDGEFFDLDGLALAHLFFRETHVLPKELLPDIVMAVVAIDPHPNKNHVAVVVGADRDGFLYYLDEFSSSRPPREFARELKVFYQPYPVFDIVCDSLGAAAMTGGDGNKSFIEVMNEEGIRARSTTFKEKSDEEWIMRIQEALTLPPEPDNFGARVPKLRFVDGKQGILKDVETVSWVKIRNEDAYKPKLDIREKDYLACLKYALATNLSPQKKKASKGYVRNTMPTSYGNLKRRLKGVLRRR